MNNNEEKLSDDKLISRIKSALTQADFARSNNFIGGMILNN